MSTYAVNNLGDSGTGSLRWAIDQADRDQSDDTINLAASLAGQTIALTSGGLQIFKISGTLTIKGPGADLLAVSGGGHSQVFDVLPRTTITISGLTITGGAGPFGGGILNSGNLTMTDDTISGNSAYGGGGGGIDNDTYGTLAIIDSTIGGNTSRISNGGGISNEGKLAITDSTISGNTALTANGGGIINTGTLTVINSTIGGNTATASGAGGGIENLSGLTMFDDTVAGNSADASGGGIDNEAFEGGLLSLSNTIVADNMSADDPRTCDLIDDADLDNSHLVGWNDLIGSGHLGALQHTLVGIDPKLGPLQDNGGPTETMALLAGSPAINAGDNALVPPGINTDQRGELPRHRRWEG